MNLFERHRDAANKLSFCIENLDRWMWEEGNFPNVAVSVPLDEGRWLWWRRIENKEFGLMVGPESGEKSECRPVQNLPIKDKILILKKVPELFNAIESVSDGVIKEIDRSVEEFKKWFVTVGGTEVPNEPES